ncbi:MAG: 16S rRNA (cytidine(1402)-2'-O)-methyltransferase [Gammaproteobacteria bacterium]
MVNGALYIVATPIGNLADMTMRAIEVLRGVALIAAEDTRHSRVLLQHFGIDTPCLACHEHNERQQTERLIERLQTGEAVALISDAGTPLLSDPGFHLVRAAHAAGIRVIPIPGPSAALAALSASGVPTDRFVFEGFLPGKQAARRERLMALRSETRTLLFYEAPHRLLATLEDMAAILGHGREAVLARELTKLYETIRKDSLGVLWRWVEQDPDQQKGECVLVVQGAVSAADEGEADLRHTLGVLLEELPLKQAVGLAMKITGEKRNRLYQWAVEMKEGGAGPR